MVRTSAFFTSILLAPACGHTSGGHAPVDATVSDAAEDADAGFARADGGALLDGGERDAELHDRDAASLDAASDRDGGRADASASCAEEANPSGACRYLVSDGTAIITKLEAAPATSNRCYTDPVRVMFRFVPDDPASERCAHDGDVERSFVVGDGKAPPRSCIDGAAIGVGSELRVRRRDIVAGSCTPVVFTFDAKVIERCNAECFR